MWFSYDDIRTNRRENFNLELIEHYNQEPTDLGTHPIVNIWFLSGNKFQAVMIGEAWSRLQAHIARFAVKDTIRKEK